MFELNKDEETNYRFSRFDLDSPFSSCSEHPIFLDERNWSTCEHYVQANIVRSKAHAEIIDKLPTAEDAIKYAKPWYRSKIKDYRKLAPVLMTRALYTKVQMYREVKDALLATGDKKIIESSQYDYFWGIGRDLRGYNYLGKAWMNIREKLLSNQNPV